MEQAYPRDDGFAAPSEPTAQSAQQAMTPSSSRLLSSLSLDEARPHQAKPSEDPAKTSADSLTKSNEDTLKTSSPTLLPSTLHKLPLELRQLCYSFAMIANETLTVRSTNTTTDATPDGTKYCFVSDCTGTLSQTFPSLCTADTAATYPPYAGPRRRCSKRRTQSSSQTLCYKYLTPPPSRSWRRSSIRFRERRASKP
jgi:hypothetical protein